MIRADQLVTGLSEVATLSVGAVPRIGEALRELGTVRDAALAIDGGRFAWIGPERSTRSEVRVRSRGKTWDAGGGVAVPGFVDAHTHLLFAGDRSREISLKLDGLTYPEIARRGGGLFSTVRNTRRASSRTLVAGAISRIRRMLAYGSTTIEVKSGYALTHAGELRLLELVPRLARATGVRLVPTFLGAHAIPPEFHGRSDAYVDGLRRRTLPEVARRRLARFCDVFCEPGFVTVRQSERLLRTARSLGLEAKIHAEEFVRSGGAQLAARLHAVSAEHLLEATARDRSALARSGVTAVLLPTTPFASLASRRSPGRECVDDGVPVALGTDLSPNSWVESMPLVLAHAVYSAHLTPAEALSAATVNAAHAVGAGDSAGQIAVGRPADYSVFDLASSEEIGYRVGAIPRVVSRQGNRVFSREVRP